MKMTHLYSATGLFHPKNTIKLPTQSAEKWICIMEWAFEMGAELFLKNEKAPDSQIF